MWDPLRDHGKWHLDKVSITINGERKYFWRAVDRYGNLLDILVQNRRNKASGRTLLPSVPPRKRGGGEGDRHAPCGPNRACCWASWTPQPSGTASRGPPAP
ncbi:DDE-type integrase/transposase/recombinase [Streptomyces sp. NPDC056105]|uniref:DDE-type integrase/transposase/recombinase n=1 Tax=Streptomyces sp. NPDC056105 TaxID=3345714 RepID=UPI0035DD3F53